MKVSLSGPWEQFITRQLDSGEFADPNEVVHEGLRLLRDDQERRAMEHMRAAFAGVDAQAKPGESKASDRLVISELIREYRHGRALAKGKK